MAKRRRISAEVETAVLCKSRRRCCLCYHLQRDFSEKIGQIAHLDSDASNSIEENLVFLCTAHHSLYDSTTSQHKNYSPDEVRSARKKLYVKVLELENDTIEWVLILDGKVRPGDRSRIEVLAEHLRNILKDGNLTIKEVRQGSIVLVIKSSEAAFKRMQKLIKNREISELLGCHIRLAVRKQDAPDKRTSLKQSPSVSTRAIEIFHGFTAQYIQRLKEGDPYVEDHFTAYFGELIFIKLRNRLRPPELIEDVRQETLLRVIRTIRSDRGLDHPERLGVFVFSVCNNVMHELLRLEQRHGQLNESASDLADDLVDLDLPFVTEEKMRLVESILKGLPSRDRQILQLLYLEGKTDREICQELGVDEGYIRVATRRFFKRTNRIGLTADALYD